MHNLHPTLIREQVIRTIRTFFYERNFHEIITPTLNSAIPIEPNIHSFSTTLHRRSQDTKLFLSTSPERGLKRMLAHGIGNCFAFGKCFRNLEGSGSKHIPEYLMLEWYREDATYHDIMKDLQVMIRDVKDAIDRFLKKNESSILIYQNNKINMAGPWPIHSLPDLFKTYARLDMEAILTEEGLFPVAEKKGYRTDNASWNELFDQIFVQEIESQMPLTPYFITDFPARLSPLCKKRTDNPELAERFEFFLAGMEIGNGNNESTDYQHVEELFIDAYQKCKQKNTTAPPIDRQFLQALKQMDDSGTKYAGIGLGIDRLAMIMADCKYVTDVEILSVCSDIKLDTVI